MCSRKKENPELISLKPNTFQWDRKLEIQQKNQDVIKKESYNKGSSSSVKRVKFTQRNLFENFIHFARVNWKILISIFYYFLLLEILGGPQRIFKWRWPAASNKKFTYFDKFFHFFVSWCQSNHNWNVVKSEKNIYTSYFTEIYFNYDFEIFADFFCFSSFVNEIWKAWNFRFFCEMMMEVMWDLSWKLLIMGHV